MSERTESLLSNRLEKLFKDLPPQEAKDLLEELIDEYCFAAFGTSIIKELKEADSEFIGKVNIQHIGFDKKAILISRDGYDVVNTAIVRNGVKHITLEERNIQNDC